MPAKLSQCPCTRPTPLHPLQPTSPAVQTAAGKPENVLRDVIPLHDKSRGLQDDLDESLAGRAQPDSQRTWPS
jgi:hypothetical protein